MCVIIDLEANASMDEEMLTNAVYNNSDGYGLIVVDQLGNLDVTRTLPEDKETKPQEIIKLLNDNQDKRRILHLRWATVGKVTLDNAHPFKIYENEGDEAWFMHNGTLYGYGSDDKGFYGVYSCLEDQWYDDDEDISDSRDFAMKVLEPFIDRWEGDYADWHFKMLLQKFWTDSSKGIIVSNYDDPYRFGSGWKELDSDCSVGTVHVSNDTYFNRVQRGPEFERRKKAYEEKQKGKVVSIQDCGNKSRDSGFLQFVDIADAGRVPIHFNAIRKVFGELPLNLEPEKVLDVCRSLTNDECAALVINEYEQMALQGDDWDYEKSPIANILLAMTFFLDTLIEDYEEHTGKKAEDTINASASAERQLSGSDIPFDCDANEEEIHS
jgi:predicted glutamine amidotransferase